MKNVNNFQIAKVQPQGYCLACLIFCQLQPRRKFSLVAGYSLKFTRCSLLVTKFARCKKLLVARCKIRSLLIA